MKTAAGRFLLILCLSAQPLWAGPVGVEAQKAGTTNPNTGLTGGNPTTNNNSGLGSGGITTQQLPMTGTLGAPGSMTPTPTVQTNKPVTAAPIVPGSIVTPSGNTPETTTPQQGLTQTPVTKTNAPAPQKGVENAVSPAALPGGFTASDQAAPAAGKTLETGVQAIRQGASAEAAGMGESAVHQALDRIFDASHAAPAQGQGLVGIAGSQAPIADKIKKTVALANTSAPRNAPDLYISAIKTAEDSFPTQVAGEVKLAVLDYAARKAATALPELSNQAYQSAAGGAVTEVKKAFASLNKWEKLLGQPGRPLIANRERLESDVARVLDEGTKAAAEGRGFSAPRIWFARVGALSFNAVLPTASVAAVPAELAESLALKDALAPTPLPAQAFMAFQARPSLANGFNLVYQAHRGAGRSTVGSAYAAASYGFKAFLARLWHAVRDFVLRLAGRAPATAIGQGFSVTPSAALAQPARSDTVSLSGAHLQVARSQEALPDWRRSLEAINALQAEHALARGLLSRQAPLDLQTARVILGLASAMASNAAVITGEDAGSGVVRNISGRLEQSAREEGLGPSSRLTPAMTRLISDPEGGSLRQWLARLQESSQERVLAVTGQVKANLSLSRQGGAAWALTDLGSLAPAAGGRLTGAGLRAAARLFIDAGAVPQGSFVVMDRVLLGRWDGERGRGKVLAVLASAAEGGAVRILYENPAGVAAAAQLLNGLGLAVETRGQALSASLSAQVSDAGGAALAATLSQAVNALQTGREPGPAVSGATRGENAAAVRKLISDLKGQKAAAVAQALQSAAPEALRLVTIGRVDGSWAQSGRLVLDDGRVLTVTLLKDPESGLFTAARAEVSGPGEKPRVLAPAELGVLLRGE